MGGIVCFVCSKTFSQYKHLYAHLRNIHNKQPSLCRAKNCVVCPSCSNIVSTYADLRDHVITVHNINVIKEQKCFQNRTDFFEWKSNKERELKCSYFKPSGTKIKKKCKKEYYLCHRSYQPEKYKQSTGVLIKRQKQRQRIKIMHSCPSTIELVETSGQFNATIYLPHLGHECSLKYLNLSAFERTQIAGKISECVSFERILDDVRNSVCSDHSLERIHLIDRQDLRNIKRQFNLTPQYHQNDVISVDLMISHMQTLQEDSPILYYKKQGVVDQLNGFDASVFFLAIMTSFQKNMAKKFGHKKICVDSTHGTTGYDFLLTTILTVDEYGEGLPIAFLISNKTDTTTLSFYFKLIKERIGFSLATETFMSDDAPEFYNAWSNIMEVPRNKLLCVWHVDKNWRLQISRKVHGDQELKANVYKHLRCLMECQSQTKFDELMSQVVNNLLIHNSTEEFGQYFNDYYVNRPHQWAFCFRRGLGINTNMFLESMHKILKHIYLEGKKSKRVDKCIQALMSMVRDQLFKRLKKAIKGKVSYRVKLIQQSHKKSMDIKNEDIAKLSNEAWKVKSCSTDNKEYFIQKEKSCEEDCKLVCSYCTVCIHNYTCTCLDNFVRGNICKHIHAVSRYDKVSSSVSSNSTANLEISALHDCASQHNQLQTASTNLKIKIKLDMLYKYVSENNYDEDISLKLERLLDSALCIARKNSTKTIKSKEPANKKVDKQVRFKSTKKRKPLAEHVLRKPTSSEKKEISSSNFQNKKLMLMSVNNDHNYL